MKLSCCSWSYHRTMEAGRLDFWGWLRLCAEQLRVGGVDLIAEQLPKRTKAFCLELKKRCTDSQLTIVCLSPGTGFGQPTARGRQAAVDEARRWLDVGFVLGAPCLRVFAGFPPKGRGAELWAPMVGCLRAVAGAAAQAGITVVIEPHNAGGFLPDSRSTLRLIREVGSRWVRINLDCGNYADSDLYAGLESSLPYAPHVVAKVLDLRPSGEDRTLDYGRIFELLERRRYRGFVTLEYEGTADELATVPRALAMIQRHAQEHGF